MGTDSDQQVQVDGYVAPGFESVKELYEHNMQTLAERCTQLCIYHNDKKVVDLWASSGEVEDFTADSLVNIFSSGKSLEAIAIASLVDKGLLTYDEKIVSYWPEFANNGKQDLTIAELMRHEAGLAAFNVSIDPRDLFTDNIKQNKVGRVIEQQRQKYRPDGGSRREYHAVTRGWIVNELFRRVDPAGRTIGEFLQQDISGPLDVDALIGVPEVQLSRRVSVYPLSLRFQFLESLKPKFLKRKMEHNIFQLLARLLRFIPAMRKGTTRGSPPPFTGMDKIAFFNEPTVAMGETPSANANCSARGLAKIAAMMAAGGKWQDKEYLSNAAWVALHGAPDDKNMGVGMTTFTQGGVAYFSEAAAQDGVLAEAFNSGREGFFGWMGLGGSLFQWHPEYGIGFGYVPTSLNVFDIFNERGKTYQAEVLRCIAQMAK